ncbi:hypothetical protein AVEN_62165-1 [Araneus ventricosus]|uniref:Uncharacterized protein n=1 Tax=Araneus ventricosus TaxID=182803 RepID=A0A4Y2TER7_ARAVE|nr:hypothetical protein AVEN_190705-1 [Araneus ventricosus]GBN99126.1 hypothetical protein AVEN_62165-1 [Araneus ventricosus]
MEEAAFSRTDVWEAMRMRKSVMEGEPISGKAPLLHLSNIDTCDSDCVLRKMWPNTPAVHDKTATASTACVTAKVRLNEVLWPQWLSAIDGEFSSQEIFSLLAA